MTKIASRVLFSVSLVVLFSAPAWAQVNHNVWSTSPITLTDWATHTSYSVFVDGNASFAWSQGSLRAYAHAHAAVTPALNYDFMLVSVTSTTNDLILGRWVVRRNGAIVCNNCIGRAYNLSTPIGNYFKIYVGTPAAYAEHWHYSGKITDRFDY
jgi:hypothetical protein